MSFCVDTVSVSKKLRAQHGILRASSLQVTSDAVVAARKITEEAQAEARNVLDRAHQEARSAVSEAERKTFEQTQQLLQAIEKERETFLERGKDIIMDLAGALFDRLVAQMTPRERVEATLRRVMTEAPRRLINPVLRVNPEDVQFLPTLEWDIVEDAAIAPGSCKLVARNGEWSADFDAAVSSLKQAFSSFIPAAVQQDGSSEAEQVS